MVWVSWARVALCVAGVVCTFQERWQAASTLFVFVALLTTVELIELKRRRR